MFGCAGDFPAAGEDAEAVRRLRAAGAVIVGKTTTPELGQWPFTEGPAFGVTRNPWNRDFSPGGSSGGSAAAVAGGLVPVALGSDGAGSVRIPAAWTGLVGIKPQRGRISTWPDPESFNGLTCNGPLARTVLDAALLLDAVDRQPPRRAPPAGSPGGAVRGRRPARGSRLAAHRAVVQGALQRRAVTAGSGGPCRGRSGWPASSRTSVTRSSRSSRPTASSARRSWRGPWAASATGPGASPTARSWTRARATTPRPASRSRRCSAAARAVEPLLHRQIGRVFGKVDVLLAPTTAQPPLPIGAAEGLGGWATDKVVVGAAPYAWPWNVLGWPGVNVPAGLTEAGLPVGAQLLGPDSAEPRLIALAAQLEAVERWYERHPPALESGG